MTDTELESTLTDTGSADATGSATGSATGEIRTAMLERFLGFRLTRAKVQVHRVFQRELAALDLSVTLYSVLALCEANPGCYQRQVGTALDISAPNLVPVLDRLARGGWLTRVPSVQDRRMQELHLTPEGRSVLAQAQAIIERLEAQLEAALSPEELRITSIALDKLANLHPAEQS